MRFASAVLLFMTAWFQTPVFGQQKNSPPMVELIESFITKSQATAVPSRSLPSEFIDRFMANRKAAFLSIINRSFMSQNGRIQIPNVHVDLIWDELEAKLKLKLLSAYEMFTSSDELTGLYEITTDGVFQDHIATYLGLPKPRRAHQLGEIVSAKALGITNRLHVNRATVTAEVGGLNAGNGLADPGEWVQLALRIENSSRKPWFSTSIFTQSGSVNCLWVRSLEIEPGEFLEVGSSSTVGLWIFIPPGCTSTPILELKIKDTHRSPSGINSSVRLVLGKAPNAKIVEFVFDSDVPGESRGSIAQWIRPGDRIELSHGLEFDTNDIKSVESTMTVPADQRQIVGAETMTSPVHQISASRFEAGDDLDLAAVDQTRFLKYQKQYEASRKFFLLGESKGVLWLAVDVRALVTGESPPTPVSPASADLDRPRREFEKLTAKSIAELLKKHLRFESRTLRPKKPDAIAAVAGHDILFDGKSFEAEVAAMVESVKATEKKKPYAPGSVVFSNRLYIGVDMASLLKPARIVRYVPPVEPKVAVTADDTSKPPLTVSRAWPDVRVDLGYAGSDWVGEEQYDDAELGLFSASLFYGTAVTGFVNLYTGGGMGDVLDDNASSIDTQLWNFGLSFGAGYQFGNESLEFHPRVGLGVSYRSIEFADPALLDGYRGTLKSQTNLALVLAATARMYPTENIGFYLSWDRIMGLGGSGEVEQVYDSNASLLGIGLSLRL